MSRLTSGRALAVLCLCAFAVALPIMRDVWHLTLVALFLAAGSRILPGLLRLQGASITIRNAAVQAQPTFFMNDYLARTRSDVDVAAMPSEPVCDC